MGRGLGPPGLPSLPNAKWAWSCAKPALSPRLGLLGQEQACVQVSVIGKREGDRRTRMHVCWCLWACVQGLCVCERERERGRERGAEPSVPDIFLKPTVREEDPGREGLCVLFGVKALLSSCLNEETPMLPFRCRATVRELGGCCWACRLLRRGRGRLGVGLFSTCAWGC